MQSNLNKDTAREYLPLVVALSYGLDLQLQKCSGQWEDIDGLDAKWQAQDYRIKPCDQETMRDFHDYLDQIAEAFKD